ncbi:MAG: hypothetical protein QOK34_851, partial [Gaiellaceae bacterium]|nr:hypothetical protein [Gaiellaceae bacterium]
MVRVQPGELRLNRFELALGWNGSCSIRLTIAVALPTAQSYAPSWMRKRYFMVVVSGAMALMWSAFARADGWWPHPTDASWTYQWTDTVYNNSPTNEKVTVEKVSGKSFVLSWTTKDQGNSDAEPISFGHVTFEETTAGLVNTAWEGTSPRPEYPVLC